MPVEALCPGQRRSAASGVDAVPGARSAGSTTHSADQRHPRPPRRVRNHRGRRGRGTWRGSWPASIRSAMEWSGHRRIGGNLEKSKGLESEDLLRAHPRNPSGPAVITDRNGWITKATRWSYCAVRSCQCLAHPGDAMVTTEVWTFRLAQRSTTSAPRSRRAILG